MTEKRIKIVENILNANDQIALKNNKRIEDANTYSINLMASPGAGKTSFILATINALLDEKIQIGVIEGDTAHQVNIGYFQ